MKFSKYLTTVTVWNHDYIPYQRLKRRIRSLYSPVMTRSLVESITATGTTSSSSAQAQPQPQTQTQTQTPTPTPSDFLSQLESEVLKVDQFMQEKESELYNRYLYLLSRFRATDFSSPFSSFLLPIDAQLLDAAGIAGYKEINPMWAFQKAYEDVINQLAQLEKYAKINVWAVQKLISSCTKKKTRIETRRRNSIGEHLPNQFTSSPLPHKKVLYQSPNVPSVISDTVSPTTTSVANNNDKTNGNGNNNAEDVMDSFFERIVSHTEIGNCNRLKQLLQEVEREYQIITQNGAVYLNNQYINLLSTMQELNIANDVAMWREAIHSCIHKAASLGAVEVAKVIFDILGSIVDIDYLDEVDKKFIHIASGRGHPQFVEFLIERGARLDSQDFLKRTPLHTAAQYAHYDIVKLLLAKGAPIDVKDRDGCTPLNLASRHTGDSSRVIELLLNSGSPLSPGPYGRHLIHEAAIQANVANVAAILAHAKTDVNQLDSFGRTALFEAAKNGSTDTLLLLLAKNALIDIIDEDKRTPMHVAASRGHTNVLNTLIEHMLKDSPASELTRLINSQDYDGWTALHESAYFNFIECTKTLMTHGANPFVQDNDEWSPVVHSLYRGNMTTAHSIWEHVKKTPELLEMITSQPSTPSLRDSKGLPLPNPSPRIDLLRSDTEVRNSTSGASTPSRTPAITVATASTSNGGAADGYTRKITKGSMSNVTFRITARVKPGYRVGVIGNRKALGKWNPGKALFLTQDDTAINANAGESTWVGKATLPTDVQVEYKYIICQGNRLDMWEALPENRKFLPEEEVELLDDGTFGSVPMLDDLLPQQQPQKTVFVEKGWLVQDYQIRLRFGETSPKDPQRKLIQPIKIFGQVEVGRIVVTLKDRQSQTLAGTLPTQFTSPLSVDQYVWFQFHEIDRVATVQFDMYRAGMSSVLVGRAVLLASDLLNKSPYKCTLPIMSATLMTIGEFTVFPLVVSPFTHPRISDVLSNTYWKSTMLIGHRGGGAEYARNVGKYKRTHIKENTILSFVTAASLGAQYIEFDVQLSRDNVPIIFHDYEIKCTGAGNVKVPINKIRADQIHNLQPKPPAKTKSSREPHHQQLQRQSRSRSMEDLLVDVNGGGNTQAGSGDKSDEEEEEEVEMVSDSMTSLEETFKKVPIQTGFNIEIKYPNEEKENALKLHYLDRNSYVERILAVVFEHAGDRQVMFSSFDADICIICSLKQPRYPVFFLNNAGFSQHSDPRANSICEAIRFSKSAHLLGIVTNSKILTEGTPIIREVKQAGLMLCSWGEENNDPVLVDLQETLGVDAVIVDHVAHISRHYN
ncbi:hypothetical protein SAMD00019534_110990, partial [Acytostelium subglobosum LB1]|uniref:hypothetical protein n=1 Tax=Acytostelium subglobosum LB1 TaxID=1410327 RepID=UPI000644CC87